ncbi:zinc finger MYM-type protein 1-like [Helianthus annuus]|uniref:zinc finger MYM-type protein 1-like n=1 Tax=Helianthus annuus TaxID=4232 RepID=UPI000B904AF4|nr:zinc finger MYM-type protein 1-like [Helianthus annuus]
MSRDFMARFVKRKVDTSSELIDLDTLPSDPYDRKPIESYNVNQRDEIRRAYILRGPYQPRGIEFPQTTFQGDELRKFKEEWYDKHEYKGWLEYSSKSDRVFCLCCYLFRSHFGDGRDTFVSGGYNNWKKVHASLKKHVGLVNSLHNKCFQKSADLVNENQAVHTQWDNRTSKEKREYRLRLSASTLLGKRLLNGGLAFRGHDESKDSLNKGNFLELLELMGEMNEELAKVILENAPANNQMTSPKIQADIKHCYVQEVIKQILEELGDDVFSLLVDESCDVSKKEQMAVVIRFVDKVGIVKERFIGLVHVKETSAITLKTAIDDILARYGLSLKRIRGQGYDGASNMSGEFNGLRALILKENVSAFYIHCFAHQLQLVVVAVAHKHTPIWRVFETITCLTNAVWASSKRQDMLRESQRRQLEKMEDVLCTGSGLNQEMTLSRPGDTRWNSHYKTLSRLISLYPNIMEVLGWLVETGQTLPCSRQADGLLEDMKKYDFVFYIHLMEHILNITHTLSQCLQRKEQDLMNAVKLVSSTKNQLEKFRLEGFNEFLEKVNSFCDMYELEVKKLDDEYVNPRWPRRKTNITNRHYYEYDCFNAVLDLQIQEFGNRFNEVTSELLVCMSCLSPCDNFSAFDIPNILKLAEKYPYDFNEEDKRRLPVQLGNYFDFVKKDKQFANLDACSRITRRNRNR